MSGKSWEWTASGVKCCYRTPRRRVNNTQECPCRLLERRVWHLRVYGTRGVITTKPGRRDDTYTTTLSTRVIIIMIIIISLRPPRRSCCVPVRVSYTCVVSYVLLGVCPPRPEPSVGDNDNFTPVY